MKSLVPYNVVFFLIPLMTTTFTASFAFAPRVTQLKRLQLSRTHEFEPHGLLLSLGDVDQGDLINRRSFWKQSATAATLLSSVWLSPSASLADEDAVVVAPPTTPMKEFVDPMGFFSIRVPKTFFTLRRSAKGDLPDSKTGQGRRGSSIFSAGDMSKAEIVAVERFPTRVLLEENGMEATGDLTTFPGLGKPAAVATLLNLRRERDKPTQANTQVLPGSVSVSNDGKVLRFALKSEIEVQKPELLMEQYGVSQLFRVTLAKASLEGNDGNLMAVFASALEQDFNGPDGAALEDTVSSFTVLQPPETS